MKNYFATLGLALALTLGTISAAWSADFQKGVAAYNSGDYATALREWTPLAKQGDARAQYSLGLMYRNGYGVPKNDKTAVKWWTLAAEQGNASAQSVLGSMYDEGEGVPKNDKTAVKWYRLAAEQGDAGAQTSLGFMYYTGEGVPQDNVYAHMWFNIAASSGDKGAVRFGAVVERRMTPSQITEAQTLARECVRKNYKGC